MEEFHALKVKEMVALYDQDAAKTYQQYGSGRKTVGNSSHAPSSRGEGNGDGEFVPTARVGGRRRMKMT